MLPAGNTYIEADQYWLLFVDMHAVMPLDLEHSACDVTVVVCSNGWSSGWLLLVAV